MRKPATRPVTEPSPSDDGGAFVSSSVAGHLTRGAIGFGLIGSAVALTAPLGPAALLLAAPGMLALRGCPTCWVVGLIQTISAGRLRRTCAEGECAISRASILPTGRATQTSRGGKEI